jgi:hypothetical protein
MMDIAGQIGTLKKHQGLRDTKQIKKGLKISSNTLENFQIFFSKQWEKFGDGVKKMSMFSSNVEKMLGKCQTTMRTHSRVKFLGSGKLKPVLSSFSFLREPLIWF